jgi:hypothetical protein
MGEGPFELSSLAAGLRLRPETDTHGLVEPEAVVPLEQYQANLAATRDQWIIDER